MNYNNENRKHWKRIFKEQKITTGKARQNSTSNFYNEPFEFEKWCNEWNESRKLVLDNIRR